MKNKGAAWFREHWLWLLIAAQPVLDAVAFFMQNEVGTLAGYIRLLILVALPLCVLFRAEKKKPFVLSMLVIGLFCLLHLLNGFRVGYISLYYDLSYMVRVVQMPVFALCFVYLVRDDQVKGQAYRGVLSAAVITGVFLLIAWITGTGTPTYSEGLGFSGWVIEDNRCANSILLVTLSAFSLWVAARTPFRPLSLAIPPVIAAVFLTNGTKACFYSLFVLFAGYVGFLLLDALLRKEKLKTLLTAELLLLMVFTVLIYPYTPRYRVSAILAKAATQGEIENALLEKGIDITDMSTQERFENPVVKEVFTEYYWKYTGSMPDLIDRFGIDRVLLHYDMTTDVAKLIDSRVIERAYSAMIFEDSDLLTKLVGFEVSQVGFGGLYDLENDWHSIFYYYGYLGFALYLGFLLWFLLRVGRTLIKDFRGSFNDENFNLMMVLLLQLGLAHFSGQILRRPNVSIYLSLVLALIWYRTRTEGERL